MKFAILITSAFASEAALSALRVGPRNQARKFNYEFGRPAASDDHEAQRA